MITITDDAVFPDGQGSPSLPAIGVGLGRMARFNGQTERFYTVLWHSVVVSQIIDQRYAVHGLMHDAAESVVADVCGTWKTDEARQQERVLLGRIYVDQLEPLGIVPPDDAAIAAVADADFISLAAEAHVLGHRQAEFYWPRDTVREQYGEAFDRAIALTDTYCHSVLRTMAVEEAASTFHEYLCEAREWQREALDAAVSSYERE